MHLRRGWLAFECPQDRKSKGNTKLDGDDAEMQSSATGRDGESIPHEMGNSAAGWKGERKREKREHEKKKREEEKGKMDQASHCKYLPEATGEPSINGTRQNPESVM